MNAVDLSRKIDLKREVSVLVAKSDEARIKKKINGKLYPSKRVNLKFTKNGSIKRIKVSNGSKVSRGTLLASLETEELQMEHTKKLIDLRQALVEHDDKIVSLGYNPEDTLLIPPTIRENVRIKSELPQIYAQIREVEFKIRQSSLKAPFDGYISDVIAQEFAHSSEFEYICTIHSIQAWKLEFYLLESDLRWIQLNETVEFNIISFPNLMYKARISEINPRVSNEGLIQARAIVQYNVAMPYLLDGMNAKVLFYQNLGEKIALPQSALTKRGGQQVVFVYEKGQAIWRYVETAAETSDSVYIESGIHNGDTIIIQGNTHLSHKSPVTLKID